jgi:hypothetical protein
VEEEVKDDRARQLFDDYPLKEREKFKKWLADNPNIFERFKAEALKMKARGWEHYSGYPILYHMRFQHDLEVGPKAKGDVFRINNNYLSMLIRLLIYRCPEFDGWFELREVRMKGIMSAEERRRREEEDT